MFCRGRGGYICLYNLPLQFTVAFTVSGTATVTVTFTVTVTVTVPALERCSVVAI